MEQSKNALPGQGLDDDGSSHLVGQRQLKCGNCLGEASRHGAYH